MRVNLLSRCFAGNSRTSIPRLRREGSAADEAAAVRAEITRRMLSAANQEAQNLRPAVLGSAATSWRIGGAVGIAALLPAASARHLLGGRRAGGDRTGRECRGSSPCGRRPG